MKRLLIPLIIERRRMGGFLGRFLLPLLLLAASLLDWSLISLINMLMFIAIQLTTPRRGFYSWRLFIISWCTIIYSILAILAQILFNIFWCIEGKDWSVAHAWWANLVGFIRDQPWGSTSVIYFLIIQLSAALVALINNMEDKLYQDSCWLSFSLAVHHIGYHLRFACCLLLPAIQLVAGISYPSWISLPFFVFSCVGLVDWSLTSNFLGLFRWWRPLQIYAFISILLLYIYQLPVKFPSTIQVIVDFIGLYKITSKSEWPELSSGLSLLTYFFLLSSVKQDLQDMDFAMSTESNSLTRRNSLTERLLPSKHTFFIHESRSGERNTNVLLRDSVFRNFSINFFTYGFPVLLLALTFWSFNFTSICAFGLLAYVGYILYSFPSLVPFHRLNGSLLVFILLWAASTYIFNVAFTFFNKEFQRDMVIWETIGLWHYSVPGLFLLAQFCLGVFVALCNLVNNSVFIYLPDNEHGQSSNDDHPVEALEEEEDTIVLIIATLAWGLRKCSRAITLALLFLLVIKPGFIHAVYMCFFLVYLLSHSIEQKVRQILILFCEVHFSILYILQLDLISSALERSGSLTMEVLSQLGLSIHATIRDFVEIGLLVCFCAVHNHGFDMLYSLSKVLKHAPYPPLGFSILKAGLNKSVLFSVYASASFRDGQSLNSSHDKRIATYLGKVSQMFLSTYRSYGTYVAFLTILLTLYLVTPNYISFGYLFFLLFWIIGRQLVEKARRRLWFPLKLYATIVFIFIYTLSISPTFATWLSHVINLYPEFGFNPEASLLENVWESLAVLIVMQLYSYERRQSRFKIVNVSDASEIGVLGFIRRLLIWHSDKILSATVFYASLSSISLFGFIYLLGLIVCSLLPKASGVPSKLFLVYTGLLAATEYLFQLWCKPAQMCPGQRLYNLSVFLGFKYYDSGFWGLESGLRGKILVIVACTLQYNIFHWLKMMPNSLIHKGKWEEPCQLFISTEDSSTGIVVNNYESKVSMDSIHSSEKERLIVSNTSASCRFDGYQTSESLHNFTRSSDDNTKKWTKSFAYIWGSSNESHKWNKGRILGLRKERLEMQKTTLKIYMKFWMENIFKLRGLEINMIVLLLASFTLLNVISMFYIICLIVCILLNRDLIRKLWPFFVFLFASVLVLEYLALWKYLIPWINSSRKTGVHCRDCWNSSSIFFSYCMKCWLGVIVDDPRVLVSYYVVFIVSSFKLRSDHSSGFSDSYTYRQMRSQRKNTLVWRDLSFETKSFWTFLDYVRLYSYCHLLDIVLFLILITGTLEYDVLHLGYLGFALVFFRMRLEILKKKNKIFKFLRMYNFALIVLSLAYQSPFLGDFSSGKCEQIDYLYEVIGLYKYDYGFRITSRSALVEIVIFLLVSVQSYIFNSEEFDYVARYLEAEQIGSMVREQEKKAARKTTQLKNIREAEEEKRQRNLQVEKMKSEMLNLQIQLNSISSATTVSNSSSQTEGLRRRRISPQNIDKVANVPDGEIAFPRKQENVSAAKYHSFDFVVPDMQNNIASSQVTSDSLQTSNASVKSESSFPVDYVRHSLDPLCEISEVGEKDVAMYTNLDKKEKERGQHKENPLRSAVQLIGDGVSQVQSLGNQAVTNIVSFLNIEPEESDSSGHLFVGERGFDGIENQITTEHEHLDRTSSVNSSTGANPPTSLQIGKIFQFIWSQMRSNNDIVCYCCFILVFLWNFSLLSMVYLAALFLYALCVNSGPSYLFWIIMLIYTELNILLQYLYQIIIQHCGLSVHFPILERFGFPENKIKASFVVSTLPLFLVYISTLLQSSITAKDGEWVPVTEFGLLGKKSYYEETRYMNYGWRDKLRQLFSPVINLIRLIFMSFSRYWKSLTQGSESPPYFVQLTMEVNQWPKDGIQPQRIESKINELLRIAHKERCEAKIPSQCHSASRVRIQSFEKSSEKDSLALAVLEVVYASPSAGCPEMEWHRSLTPAADVAAELQKAHREGLFDEMDFPYPVVSIIGGGKREVDLYAYVFGADLAVFFLVATFYQSVIKNKSEFLDVYQLEDQFPKEFVFILMVLFFLIVVDRIIYLWSFAIGKVVFYLFNLVLFTYSVTEYAWCMEPSNKNIGGLALRAIYLTKSISLALQALQIRYGLPNKSTLYRQFLTSQVTQVNFLGFRLYRALPFLYELRCVLDWSCTTTSLTMYDWLKLEDIYASLFLVKCDAVLNRAKHQPGQKQSKMTKFCSGICLFFILICVIWAPMLIYSSGNPTNIANPVIDVSVQVDIKAIGGRLTLFQTTLCDIFPWKSLASLDILDPQNYLDAYNAEDIQLICCQPDASTLWLVPPVAQNRYIRSLGQMELMLTWIFLRARPKGKESVKYESPVDNCPSMDDVAQVLNGTANSFRIIDAYPRYFRVTGSGEVRRLDTTVDSVSGNLVMNNGTPPWWSFHDLNPLDLTGCQGLSGPLAIVVSEETPQGILGETLSKFSIWSLYITFVLAVARFIRLQCSDLRMRIPYENLPTCDRLIAICEGIYAARAEGELKVEDVLYQTLVSIYRSPHMLLEYTKPD
ncbi:piezo-type mechanosensitive ion channel homolog isoform X3 [Ananas comosus]|uniref:Piezo-type mechanosensitive ion channel homolog isoform X3 n=1 Tax=Ananas comosus TaxID=4615 RepID=A0A6P5G1R5_ANACO|nr:piezo-type mechanosensitive ion channel homolog isoform X3 [Ananas comosus]